jgi:hypothetical protein
MMDTEVPQQCCSDAYWMVFGPAANRIMFFKPMYAGVICFVIESVNTLQEHLKQQGQRNELGSRLD